MIQFRGFILFIISLLATIIVFVNPPNTVKDIFNMSYYSQSLKKAIIILENSGSSSNATIRDCTHKQKGG